MDGLHDPEELGSVLRRCPCPERGFPATAPALGDHQRCTARLWNVHRKRRTRRDYEGLHGFDGDSGLLSGTRPRENMERPRRSVRLR
jgi:hypothetical protein